jgi:hypothetical protein
MKEVDLRLKTQQQTVNVVSDLIDALSTDDFDKIVCNHTKTEIDFQTVVLFIKLYMMARKVTDNKEEIKSLINFAIKDSFMRSQIIHSELSGTLVNTFMKMLKNPD